MKEQIRAVRKHGKTRTRKRPSARKSPSPVKTGNSLEGFRAKSHWFVSRGTFSWRRCFCCEFLRASAKLLWRQSLRGFVTFHFFAIFSSSLPPLPVRKAGLRSKWKDGVEVVSLQDLPEAPVMAVACDSHLEVTLAAIVIYRASYFSNATWSDIHWLLP